MTRPSSTPPRLKHEHIEAQNRVFHVLWLASHSQGTDEPPRRHDGSLFTPEEAEQTYNEYLGELQAARKALLADPPDPQPFHACLERYGLLALARLMNDPDVLTAMIQWWGLLKWGNRSMQARVRPILQPIGEILTRKIPGRTGSLSPTPKDAEKIREGTRQRRRKSDAQERKERERLTTASPKELATALQSRSAPTRKAAVHVQRQREREDR